MSERHAHFRQTTPPVEKVEELVDSGDVQVQESEPIPFSRYVHLSSWSSLTDERPATPTPAHVCLRLYLIVRGELIQRTN
jgi:hypothetical protein